MKEAREHALKVQADYELALQLERVAESLIQNQVDLDPDFRRILNENLWDLVH